MTDNQSVKDRLKIYIKYLGIGQSKFEKQCNLSNGYINNSKGNFGASKLEYILKLHPELNREWLLTGEGEMLKSSVQEARGDNNTQIAGNSNNVNTSAEMQIALNEISEMRKLVQEQVRINKEQTDKFLAIIEKLTEK